MSSYRASRVVGSDQDILWPKQPGHRAYVCMYAMIDGSEERVYHDIGLVADVSEIHLDDVPQNSFVLHMKNGLWLQLGRGSTMYPAGHIEGVIERAREAQRLFLDGEVVE